jgi:hypothetical protein
MKVSVDLTEMPAMSEFGFVPQLSPIFTSIKDFDNVLVIDAPKQFGFALKSYSRR